MTDFTLDRVLKERRDEIVARFVAELQRKDVPPPGLSRSRLADHIPRFLDEIGQELATRLHATRRASGGLEGIRLLVVDDDADALELLGVLFETSGIEVRTSDSAEAALAMLDSFSPDVIVSDIAMPGDDGYSLIRCIRTLPLATAVTPAIALTAYARSEDRNRALVEGFNAHLAKPVDPSELLTTIADLAGRLQTPK
jgi:CheY-like chemotaxis protein